MIPLTPAARKSSSLGKPYKVEKCAQLDRDSRSQPIVNCRGWLAATTGPGGYGSCCAGRLYPLDRKEFDSRRVELSIWRAHCLGCADSRLLIPGSRSYLS